MTTPAEEQFESRSVRETEAIASLVAERFGGGMGGVVAIAGELGAGKTQFVRGLVAALGGDPRQVHSPTFVLLHEYACAGRRLFHLDAYRVVAADVEGIGFDELLAAARAGDVLAIEWPQNVAALIPPGAVRVQIEPTSPTRRRIEVTRP